MKDLVLQKQIDQLPVEIYRSMDALGKAAAGRAAGILKAQLENGGLANITVATGNSQLAFYEHLVRMQDIDWGHVRIFHMDEYVGIAPTHPASFRRYLREKLIDLVNPAAFFDIAGDALDLQAECDRYAALLAKYPAHLCCLGFGENGHLAFNDPSVADFHDKARVKIVRLEERSRLQQVGEGHFPTLEQVPTHAVTLTIPALLSAQQVLAIVPEGRKAKAVARALTGPISTACPASILRTMPQARLYLDVDSASLLVEGGL
jgi:glucosamine-6-phosphate deaminase